MPDRNGSFSNIIVLSWTMPLHSFEPHGSLSFSSLTIGHELPLSASKAPTIHIFKVSDITSDLQ